MKKLLTFILMLLAVTLTACGFSSRAIQIESFVYNNFLVDFSVTNPQKILIRSFDDLQSYIDEIDESHTDYLEKLNTYDDVFFENNSLVFINFFEETDGNQYSVGVVGGGGSTLQIDLERIYSNENMANSYPWNIIIELKNTTYGFTEINLHIIDSNSN